MKYILLAAILFLVFILTGCPKAECPSYFLLIIDDTEYSIPIQTYMEYKIYSTEPFNTIYIKIPSIGSEWEEVTSEAKDNIYIPNANE